jgi:hypothetical protein
MPPHGFVDKHFPEDAVPLGLLNDSELNLVDGAGWAVELGKIVGAMLASCCEVSTARTEEAIAFQG